MPTINKTAVVPYSAEQMYALVDNIEQYPEFLPWCNKSEVLSRTEDEVRATLHLAKGAIHKSFTTCNRLQPGKMIEVRLISGPFRQLEGFWRFEDVSETTSKVALDLEFEFSSRLLRMAIGPIFHQVANSFVDVFCQRAQAIYD